MAWSTPPDGPDRGEDRYDSRPGQGDDPGSAGVVGAIEFTHPSGVVITDIQVRPVNNERLRGWATVTFNNVFVIKGIRIIMGNNRLFVAMPSRPQKDGSYQDVAHPITKDFRDYLEDRILEVYERRTPAR